MNTPLGNEIDRLREENDELLEALKICHAALTAHPDGDPRATEDIEKTRWAIAKAEGTLEPKPRKKNLLDFVCELP